MKRLRIEVTAADIERAERRASARARSSGQRRVHGVRVLVGPGLEPAEYAALTAPYREAVEHGEGSA